MRRTQGRKVGTASGSCVPAHVFRGYSGSAARQISADLQVFCEKVAEADMIADWVVKAIEVDVLAGRERMLIQGCCFFSVNFRHRPEV